MTKPSADKILFTPGPLTTSLSVKEAMLRDLGSRDFEFIQTVRDIRAQLLSIGEVSEETYTAIPMQGSGTFGLEAVLSSCIPPDGKLLVVINGAYGKRIEKIASVLKIDIAVLEYPENELPSLEEIDKTLASDPAITHVEMVSCETTTGIFNPVREVGEICAKHDRLFFVDAMSSFGAVPLNLAECHVDYLVSSANKCIEGVPGFSFAIARKEPFLKTEGFARSLSFDLYGQWKGLESNGQFRFTPPTHTLLAFRQALRELDEEGGVTGRAARYKANYETLVSAMREMGFEEYLQPEIQGYIITSFRYPNHPQFDFEEFYRRLNERDQVIYPGKVSNADCFRIGNIGRIDTSHVKTLIGAIREVMTEMKIDLPLTAAPSR
ncbi:MAG: 2-aminoethylphosphonate--pyruvate transaminase [bacterium]|nr:2-aminoethylphosphonate--pyruvate transaminase [bacterium]